MNRFDSSDHLEALTRHNALLSQQITERRIEVKDPIEARTQRERKIIDAALLSLASGNTKTAEELLRKL